MIFNKKNILWTDSFFMDPYIIIHFFKKQNRCIVMVLLGRPKYLLGKKLIKVL